MSERPTRDVPGPAVLPWAIVAATILAQQVGSRAVRDGLFLSQVSAARLPLAMLSAAVVAVPVVLFASSAIAHKGPGRVAPAILLASAALFFAEWALLPRAAVSVAWLLYLHLAALGGVLVSAFFSAVAERFDPRAARRAIGRITSGAAIGGLAGGLLVSRAAGALDTRALLLVLGVMNLGCALGLARIGEVVPAAAGVDARPSAALRSLGRSAYLRALAYLVLLTGFTSVLIDFAFKARAAEVLGTGAELMQLFAGFYTATALLTALLQTTFGDRVLARLGLAGTLSILPASVLVTGALGVAVPALWSRALLRGTAGVLESSLFRSAYEPLYTPLSADARRSTKTLIDVAAGRLGEALGSGSALLLLPLLPSAANSGVILLAMAGAALSLLLALKLQSGYVAELAASLRSGSVKLDPSEVRDSATQLTLSQTMAEVNRAELLAQIEALRTAPRASVPPAGPESAAPPAAAPQADTEHAALLSAAADLLSAELRRVSALFARGPLDPRLLPFAIELLQHKALVAPVTAALQAVAGTCAGQLIDALNDTRLPLATRRRIPSILREAGHRTAAQGLSDALRADDRELRYRAAIALVALTARRPELAPEPAAVFERLRDELRATEGGGAELRHLFALLSLALERGALALARRALGSGDARQRGTALEYLHNVLPEPLRDELIARLEAETAGSTAPLPPSSRPPSA